jgi:hypothetical protein
MPSIAAGILIPFTTNRYDAEMPTATAMIVQQIFMIQPFTISSV